jgi:hypothetical protein
MRGLRLATLLAVVLSLGALAGSARADNTADARATTDRFVTALLSSDGAMLCSLLSPRALTALGGAANCPGHFNASSGDSGDFDALQTLSKAYSAARRSSAARRGDFVRKGFTVKKLARDMERIDTDLTVKVGKGPRAAAGQLATTAVLDTRTNARRVVIYTEGDSGAIFRASGTAFSDPVYSKVAQGIPEAPKPPPTPQPPPSTVTYTIDTVTVASDGKAYVAVTINDTSSEPPATSLLVVLVPSAAGYQVDDLLVSLVSIFALVDSSSGGGIIVVGP